MPFVRKCSYWNKRHCSSIGGEKGTVNRSVTQTETQCSQHAKLPAQQYLHDIALRGELGSRIQYVNLMLVTTMAAFLGALNQSLVGFWRAILLAISNFPYLHIDSISLRRLKINVSG